MGVIIIMSQTEAPKFKYSGDTQSDRKHLNICLQFQVTGYIKMVQVP